jgi:CheY-like chemotaxis protein
LLLNHLGHDAQAVFDGPSALERVRDFKPQFILIDIVMPNMDGVELSKKLAKVRPKPKLIGVTGYPLKADDPRREAFSAVLFKPVKLEELLAAISSG